MRRFLAIDGLFSVRSGDFHATDQELGPGDVPLVSCGDVNHGLVGFYDIPEANQYQDAVTVAYNGRPLSAKYRPMLSVQRMTSASLNPASRSVREPSSISQLCSMPEGGDTPMDASASRPSCNRSRLRCLFENRSRPLGASTWGVLTAYLGVPLWTCGQERQPYPSVPSTVASGRKGDLTSSSTLPAAIFIHSVGLRTVTLLRFQGLRLPTGWLAITNGLTGALCTRRG